jgi:hypothetical protein
MNFPSGKSGDTIELKSFSGNDTYLIHTSDLTCSCQDFIKHRHFFEVGDPRRFCKHLIHVLLNSGNMPEWANQYHMKFQILYESKKGFPQDKYPSILTLGDVEIEIWLPDRETGDRPPGPWCDIYISGDRYGYNYKEWRWTSDRMPPCGKEIIAFINKELGQSTIPDSIPKGGIITIDRKNGICRGKFGDIDFLVNIMPRENWQSMAVGKNYGGSVNVREHICKLNPALKHLEESIMEWVMTEFTIMKATGQQTRKNRSKTISHPAKGEQS